MCAKCINGHFRSDNFECTRCRQLYHNIILFVFFFGICIAAIVLLVKATIQATSVKKPLYAVYLKIFFNHYQLLQVIGKIQFDWPFEFKLLLKIQNYLMEIPYLVLSTDCILMQLFFGEDSNIRYNYIKIVSSALLPIGILVVNLLFWSI